YIGGTAYDLTSISYNRDYFYDPAKPHAVDHMNNNGSIFREYEYDANGNVTSHTGNLREILWDEENRIKQVTDTFPFNSPVSENYFYDHKGERKIKINNYNMGTPQLGDVAMYVNQYAAMWLSNANNINTYTKNYYVGNQRVASRIMSDAACATGTDSFDFTYFYGTDHLGSSTYLTDNSGNIVEHNEYTPWGEIWQTEDSMPTVSVGELNNPFKFTGKEMDRTGLYYYGARYYDPQVSLWMSPDPILDKYLPKFDEKDNSKLLGMGGVFNSLNLGLFTYTHQNPVKLVDPDGKAAGDPFVSIHDAAIDFSRNYNDDSIRTDREYGTMIYEVRDAKGNIQNFTYANPRQGEQHGVRIARPPNGEKFRAFAHTHGADSPGYADNKFSPKDIENATKANVPSYVADPEGNLKKFDPRTNKTTPIESNLPSDPNSVNRANTISPDVGSKNGAGGVNKIDKYQ
ncbi:MAG: DUF4329 domain-containing protein, partial [Candidatus Goldbacteria bacterium]|nr:DUF4329 domain-containing protein [Candidatus Goldiibacteriota bacterium]